MADTLPDEFGRWGRWLVSYYDEDYGRQMVEWFAGAEGFLLGRVTYQTRLGTTGFAAERGRSWRYASVPARSTFAGRLTVDALSLLSPEDQVEAPASRSAPRTD